MRFLLIISFISLIAIRISSQAVFKNPGLPNYEYFELNEYFDPVVKYVNTKISVSLKERDGLKYYYVYVNEGNKFSTEMEINYNDLTTISEKRVNLSNNEVEGSFTYNKNQVHFFDKAKNVNMNVKTDEQHFYSPFAYLISFSGFPFEKQKSVNIKSYIYEYGDVLTMKVSNLGKQKISVKAGNFECYKLELTVGGWQSLFTSQQSFLYFTVESPHYFVQYEEKDDNGKWNADQLIKLEK
jgi:hypothetical protein